MSEIELLRDTDMLQVSSWCQYFGPPELAAIFPESVFPAGCVAKPSGLLRFTLNSIRHLGLAPPFDFDVEFVGTVEKVGTPSTPAIVRWEVNQPVGRDFVTISGSSVHVLRVEGVVRPGVVLRQPPLQGVDCEGAPRAFPGWFAWLRGFGAPVVTGTDLTFHVIVADLPRTVTLSWNLFQASFGDPVSPRKFPLEAILVRILFGGRLDPSGVGLGPTGPGPIPPGPLPYREALADSLVCLACAELAFAIRDPHARTKNQDIALETVQASVERMRTAIGHK